MSISSVIAQYGDPGWTGFRSRPDALTLPEGIAAMSENMRMAHGRLSLRRGLKRMATEISVGQVPLVVPFTLSADLTVNTGTELVVPFDCATSTAVVSLTRSVSTVTATVTAHGLATDARIRISGAAQAEYNGDFTITRTGVNTFTYPVAGFPATPATGTILMSVGAVVRDAYPALTRSGLTVTASVTAHGLTAGATVSVSGAGQSEYNGGFVITVPDANTISYTIPSGQPLTPASGTVLVNAGPIVRASYDGGIFASGIFSSPQSTETGFGQEWIVLVGTDACYLWRDGETLLTKTFPNDQVVGPDDDVRVLQAFDTLFILRSRPLSGEWVRQAVTSVTRSSTTGTIVFPVAHGLTTADRVAIEGAGEAGWNHEFDIDTVVDSVTVRFTVAHSPTTPATGTITARKVQAPMSWDGGSGDFIVVPGGSHATGATYATLRSCSIASYFNNQLVIAPTPAQDTILLSDVLDYNTYDPLNKSFRANAGSADRIVALHPFAERDILVFMRNSIYRAHIQLDGGGVSIDATSYIELLTGEVGCRARDTVVTAGPYIYFLADQGVYRMDLNYSDYKVRGTQIPLSDAITDQLEGINEDAVGTSCAAWFDNRYWLLLPMGDSDQPNTMFVWSALTNEWESRDTFPAGIERLLVSDYQRKRRLFGASRTGALFLLEEREDGDDVYDGGAVVTIAGRLLTRSYGGNDTGLKRWVRMLANTNMEAGASIGTRAIFDNPDYTLDLNGITTVAAEDYALKESIRWKSHSMQLEFSNEGLALWELRNAAVDVATDRPQEAGRTIQ